jgi:hypothetical protein
MKVILQLSMLFALLTNLLSAQTTCLNITTGTQTYINDINMNHTLYPVGSVLFQTGDIRIIKADTLTMFMNASNDSICYIGRLEFNVSTAPYAQRRFTFYSLFTQGLVIDGDTLFSNSTPAPVYNGNGFTCTYANNVFTITGAFDVVHIFGSTNCVYGMCLSPDSVSTTNCINITTGTQTYLNDIRFNHIQYPVGSVLFQTGDVRIIKADTLTTFMSASNDSICYIGRLEFNVSQRPMPSGGLRFIPS